MKFFGYYIKNLFLENSVELFSPGSPSTLLDSLLCPRLLVLGGDSWDLGVGTEGVGLAQALEFHKRHIPAQTVLPPPAPETCSSLGRHVL